MTSPHNNFRSKAGRMPRVLFGDRYPRSSLNLVISWFDTFFCFLAVARIIQTINLNPLNL
ncbi:MAG: hypothetical protein VKJ46_02240 [Leptolyngbyaceae bacterium]|nr:hypothetical protein [Leptolyngbyaceae bacterium]